MELSFAVTYHACQSCAGKIHCAQCAGELTERLLRRPGIRGAALDLNARLARLEADDEDQAVDGLEAVGLFID